MNYTNKIRSAHKITEDYLSSLSTFKREKPDSPELVRFKEDGEIKCMAHCPACGSVFRCLDSGDVECPVCGKKMKKEYLWPRENLLLKVGDRTEDSFFVLNIMDYDVREEKVTMFIQSSHVSAKPNLTPEDAVRSVFEQNPRLWKQRQRDITVYFECMIWTDLHQIQISRLKDQHKFSPLDSEELESLLSKVIWLPEVLGTCEVIDTLRKHHYPVDEGPEELLRFLFKKADGKKTSLSCNEKERRKKVREEKGQIKQTVLSNAFSSSTLDAITQWQRPAFYGVKNPYDVMGCWRHSLPEQADLFWCPHQQEYLHLTKTLSSETCPVCGRSHIHLQEAEPYIPPQTLVINLRRKPTGLPVG